MSERDPALQCPFVGRIKRRGWCYIVQSFSCLECGVRKPGLSFSFPTFPGFKVGIRWNIFIFSGLISVFWFVRCWQCVIATGVPCWDEKEVNEYNILNIKIKNWSKRTRPSLGFFPGCVPTLSYCIVCIQNYGFALITFVKNVYFLSTSFMEAKSFPDSGWRYNPPMRLSGRDFCVRIEKGGLYARCSRRERAKKRALPSALVKLCHHGKGVGSAIMCISMNEFNIHNLSRSLKGGIKPGRPCVNVPALQCPLKGEWMKNCSICYRLQRGWLPRQNVVSIPRGKTGKDQPFSMN